MGSEQSEIMPNYEQALHDWPDCERSLNGIIEVAREYRALRETSRARSIARGEWLSRPRPERIETMEEGRELGEMSDSAREAAAECADRLMDALRDCPRMWTACQKILIADAITNGRDSVDRWARIILDSLAQLAETRDSEEAEEQRIQEWLRCAGRSEQKRLI